MEIFLCLSSLILAVAGDISLQTFNDDNCGGGGGTAIQNIHANGKDTTDSSGCQAQGQFNSVNVVSVDSGFQCNIYGDSACQNFLETVSTVACTPVIGQAAICFNQAAFDNPFVESTSNVAVGALAIQIFGGDTLQNQINNVVNQACASGTACDPTNTLVLSQTISPSNIACNEGLQLIDPGACSSEDCTTTIAMSGGFNDNNQRDYMKGLMQKALDTVPSPVSFVGVQVVDKDKAVQASMTVSVNSQCTSVPPPSGFQCSDALKDTVSAALATVPGVGGVSSLVFQVACDVAG
ncbi:uncharacterized protein PV07_11197 [Cladophialophora immunda]|uniref:Uncharacterized protein n=1 Tax=Cladophialophora immunda TaxID=569365 RepID=A0A0D2ADJ4_9EURO|nr:uncharacterized protein PV07_11197 [Cladophialophora immunda]KIW22957.1 hypothetical protein PV07_11197 [Cladophialophora immunda]OQU93748.1 hypothetical protein CLAIMM_00225 [Cladophialophora immunda]